MRVLGIIITYLVALYSAKTLDLFYYAENDAIIIEDENSVIISFFPDKTSLSLIKLRWVLSK